MYIVHTSMIMHIHSFFMYFASDVEIEYVNSLIFFVRQFRLAFHLFFQAVQFSNQNRILVLTILYSSSIGFGVVFCFLGCAATSYLNFSASSIECFIHVLAHASNRNCIIVVLVRRISLHKHKMYIFGKNTTYFNSAECREWSRERESGTLWSNS